MKEFLCPVKVSIAVPVYNVSLFLERCVRSLFEQTYDEIEYVFVNDGSSDDSMILLSELISQYKLFRDNIIVIDRKVNKGVAYTRNELIRNCHGDFISFVDADDFLDTDIIAKLVEKQLETNADIVSSGYFIHKIDKEVAILPPPQYGNKHEMLRHLTSQGLHHELFCRIIRRDLFIKHDITFAKDINIGEDWLLLVKLVYYASTVTFINDIGYHYNCENADSAMASLRNKYLQKQTEDIRVLLSMYNFFKSVAYKPEEDFKRYFYRKFYNTKWESIKFNSKLDYVRLCDIQREISNDILAIDVDNSTKFHKLMSCSFFISRMLFQIKGLFQ